MQLHVARLCLDCNEVYDANDCPRCGSETFAYLSRWVPAPERRVVTRAASSPEAEVYKELIEPPTSRGRMLKRGVLGIGVLAAAGWFLRRRDSEKSPPSSKRTGESTTR
jgi:predicted  nucleic acid-binding Zn-ribbon protein